MKSKLFWAIALLLGGAACTGPISPEKVAQNATPVPQAAQLFQDFCLKTLPDFAAAPTSAAKANLEPLRTKGVDAWRLPNSATILALGGQRFGNSCSIALIGDVDPTVIGQAFLDTTVQSAGTPKKKYPSDFFAYAYQMQNGSVFTYDRRVKRGVVRHIFSVSPPVPPELVAQYIYN